MRWWGSLVVSLACAAVVDCGGGSSDAERPVGLPGRAADTGGADAGAGDGDGGAPSWGEDATAPVNGGQECDPGKPFGAPALLFDPALRSATPRLSADELTIYFTSDGVGTSTDLFRATRPSRSAAFGAPAVMTAQSSPSNDNDPTVSFDHLTLFFHSGRSGNNELYSATRPSTADDFGAPSLVAGVNDPAVADAHPYYRSGGGGELYFVSLRGSATYRVHVAKKSGAGFAMPGAIDELSGAWNDWQPMVTEDGRTMVFASDRPGGPGGYDLWIAGRPDDASPWGEPAPIAELGSVAGEFAGWISADRCRLYFSSSRDTDPPVHRIYMAERSF